MQQSEGQLDIQPQPQIHTHSLVIYRDGRIHFGDEVSIDAFIHSIIDAQQELIRTITEIADVESIDTVYHSPSWPIKSTECAISFEEFIPGDKYDTCLGCKNSFKTENFDKWIRVNRSCPICRCPIEQREQSTIPSSAVR